MKLRDAASQLDLLRSAQNLPCLTALALFSGAVVLQISCFAEAERIYMLAKDTVINKKTLTSLVIPEIQVTLN